jgi:hypothetical protein
VFLWVRYHDGRYDTDTDADTVWTEGKAKEAVVVFGLVAWRATNVPYHRWNVDSYMLFSH